PCSRCSTCTTTLCAFINRSASLRLWKLVSVSMSGLSKNSRDLQTGCLTISRRKVVSLRRSASLVRYIEFIIESANYTRSPISTSLRKFLINILKRHGIYICQSIFRFFIIGYEILFTDLLNDVVPLQISRRHPASSVLPQHRINRQVLRLHLDLIARTS